MLDLLLYLKLILLSVKLHEDNLVDVFHDRRM